MTPDQYTIEEKMLDVGDGHKLYAQLWGNKDVSEAILFLHGGPGGGCSDRHKSLFNPAKQKVIFLDQRGCGNSTPKGSLIANDTNHLVADINKVTKAFGVNKLTITGGSWGSCLALVYAIRSPNRVTKMVLRGLFTGSQSEIEFIEKGQFIHFFPDVWQKFVNSAPPEFWDNPTDYHLSRILGKNKGQAKRSAFAYSELEGALLSIDDRLKSEKYEDFDPSGTIIECHFMNNMCFLPESYIMDNVKKLNMPIKLVQGRYDAVCPPITAYRLAQKLPNAELFWTTAGHSGSDRSNWDLTKALLAN